MILEHNISPRQAKFKYPELHPIQTAIFVPADISLANPKSLRKDRCQPRIGFFQRFDSHVLQSLNHLANLPPASSAIGLSQDQLRFLRLIHST